MCIRDRALQARPPAPATCPARALARHLVRRSALVISSHGRLWCSRLLSSSHQVCWGAVKGGGWVGCAWVVVSAGVKGACRFCWGRGR
eukprot:14753690-Alexandrium_andersonii.AAC.1